MSGVLKDRLYRAQGLTSSPQPEFPFGPVDVRPCPLSTQATPSAPTPQGGRGGNADKQQPKRGVVSTSDKVTPPSFSGNIANPFARGGPKGGAPTTYNMGSPGSFVGQQPPNVGNPAPMLPINPYDKVSPISARPLPLNNACLMRALFCIFLHRVGSPILQGSTTPYPYPQHPKLRPCPPPTELAVLASWRRNGMTRLF